jgi:hypothetical protein
MTTGCCFCNCEWIKKRLDRAKRGLNSNSQGCWAGAAQAAPLIRCKLASAERSANSASSRGTAVAASLAAIG